MTTIELEEVTTSPNVVDGSKFQDIVADLCSASDQISERADYYAKCFELMSEHFNVGVGILNLRIGARTLERSFTGKVGLANDWSEILDRLILRVQTDADVLLQEFRNANGHVAAHAVALPIFSPNGHAIGAVGFAIAGLSDLGAKVVLAQVDQLLELVIENSPVDSKTPKNPNTNENEFAKTAQSIVKASDYKSIEHLCFAIANSLCAKLGCEQIAIGVIRNRDAKLVAVSGMSEIPKNTPSIMAIRQAMGVCFDRNQPTVVQENGRIAGQCESSHCKMHEFWRKITNGACVATIPLEVDGECIATVSLRRQANQPFTPDDLRRAKILGESFAPALPLVDRANRSIFRHVTESMSTSLRYLCSSNGVGRAIAICLLFASLAWFSFGHMEYSVVAPARIVPEQVNTVSAPFDGMIESVYVSPGEKVTKGKLLLCFDRRDLLIEKKKILTEITSARIESNAKLQNRLPGESFLLQSQIQVLQTDLALVNEKLARAEIRAKNNGIVMPTDIHERVGQYSKLGEPLLEIANENQWHLEIETPESESRHLSLRQNGYFQSNARPDHKHPCRVEKISPSSQVVKQKNVVIAESILEKREPWMKLGMEGTVRIQSGHQPVWWVYLHSAMDYARLKLWL